jgi:hypothetical protein
VPWLVLASATPHSGDTAAYRALLALGGLGVEDRICVFRRSHDDVRLSVSRRTHVLDVRSTREERDLHSAVLAYARELCHGAAAGRWRPAAGQHARAARDLVAMGGARNLAPPVSRPGG